MSFSGDIKEELIKRFSKKQSCQKAELAAIMLLCGKAVSKDEDTGVYVYTEPSAENRKDFTSLRKTFNIKGEMDLDDFISLTRTEQEARAFLRGAFIASGTISDPEKGYHFEIVCDDPAVAMHLQGILSQFDVEARITTRRGKHVLYVKEAEEISDILNIMEAHVALMNFENVRIVREMRGSINRQVNCETANISKSINASMKQVEDINLLIESGVYDKLDDNLKNICDVRLSNPEAGLMELGELLSPPLGKSGVNHRLRKISQMARELRGE